MTIPSRPAPAPPGSRGQSAAAGANASLEQLRLQLQQQQLQQQQSTNGGLQKLSIKLPPPPKGHMQQPQQQQVLHKRSASNSSNNNGFFDVEGGSGITRKFPQARYTPATNWNDAPFDSGIPSFTAAGNNNFKKMPPPRPPPPKVQVNGRKLASLSTGNAGGGGGGGVGGGIISNIFHRKKTTTATSTAAASKAAAQNRVYGLSSGIGTAGTATASNSSSNSYTTNSNTYDWNAAWNTASTTTTMTATTTATKASSTSLNNQREMDAQLISFDSPPSSPTFTQKSNSDCVSVDSFSSDSNFSSPNNGSVSQPESGFEDDYNARSRPATQSPLVADPWEAVDNSSSGIYSNGVVDSFGAAPVRQLQPQHLVQHQATRSSDNPLCNGRSLLPPAQSLTMPTIIKPKISQKPKAPKPPPFIGQPPRFGYAGSTQPPCPPSPPMPSCAPPPLSAVAAATGHISLLDVISGKVDALALGNGSSGYVEEEHLPYAIALYDFDGVEEDDLNFRENEKIYLLEQPTPEWYRGRTRSGCEGLFPVNYVETKVPLSGCATNDATQGQQQPTQQQQRLNTARCLYNFPGEVQGDLPLRENQLVNVLCRINEDWLFGEVDGRQGQFPANFLEHIPFDLPSM
ncbi:actin cytoskeleton-regulatory complex protein pan1 [Drosophila grimshawi]|uniref:GH22281 n=1 Tax=Drosophila grimshawi TaxID=7222 RepID=B4JZ22_DROGR|nr:actin cytoskeleton-regulatory complex protein pan1 [Drosophila grimshawi]XP_032597624.1 actin cytoskeleton-regulatory complex protein pan1 [Drosophila grimshawi]EDV98637.1 GH22281 [Drosophila grimshawi]